MSRPVTLRLDRELDAQIRAWARENGLTVAQAMRDLLRQALGHADPVGRAYKEAFAVAYYDHKRQIDRDALARSSAE